MYGQGHLVNARHTLAYGAWPGTLLLHAVNAPDTAVHDQHVVREDTCAHNDMSQFVRCDDRHA